MPGVTGGELLWTPPETRRSRSRLAGYLDGLVAAGRISAPDYERAWAWSVDDLDGFWSSIGDWAGVPWATVPHRFFAGDPDGGAGPWPAGTWCPGGRLNYAQSALGNAHDSAVAVVARSQTRGPSELSGAELADLVARARCGLRRAGVGEGDRVAGYLPNIAEALVAFLAAASIGAIWTSCAPEMGVRGVLDRLAQVGPTVLIAVDGYRYGARVIDRRAEVREIEGSLPTVTRTVVVPYLWPATPTENGWWTWDELTAPTDTGGGRRPGRRRFRSSALRAVLVGYDRRARSRSCTATAPCCSSTRRRWRCTTTSGPVTGSSGTRPRAG